MPLPSTMTPIATNTLTATASAITFSSIPQTYTDLVLVINGQSNNGSAGYIATIFNGDTTALYSTTRFLGDGSNRYSGQNFTLGGTMWGSMGTVIHQIQNYSNTTTFKTFLTRDNNAANRVGITVSLYRSTTAITSVGLSCPDGSGFASGSTFTLYGIKAA
jgi:hypothetical protein